MHSSPSSSEPITNSLIGKLTGPIAATAVLVLFYVLMLASLREKSATFDEPGHLVAGYTYWKFNDYRVDPENGNLPQRWAALPLLLGDFHFPSASSEIWRNADSWLLSDASFYRMGNDAAALFARGRAMSGLFAVGLGAIVWLWSRQLFGPEGAMISLILYGLNPTVLANGALTTSDMPAAFFFLTSVYLVSRMLEKVSLARTLASGLAMAGLFASKMSAAIIIPIILVLAVARVLDRRPLPMGGGLILTNKIQRTIALGLAAIVHVVIFFTVIWALYGFRYSAFAPSSAPGHFNHPWEWAFNLPRPHAVVEQLNLEPAQRSRLEATFDAYQVLDDEWSYHALEALDDVRRNILTAPQATRLSAIMRAGPSGIGPRLIHFARERHLLPEAYLYGQTQVWKFAFGGVGGYFNGEIGMAGWRWFFPYTFLVKTPFPVFALLALAVAASLASRRLAKQSGHPGQRELAIAGSAVPTLPLWLLLGFYWTAAVSSSINIGHRHILPMYPPLFVLCGAAGLWLSRTLSSRRIAFEVPRILRVSVWGLVVALAVEVAVRFPNYLAYFNGIVSPSNAYRHLVDSSLDWGQDLPSVESYLRTHPTESAYLAYFGIASPTYYGIKARQIFGFHGIDWTSSSPILAFSGANPRRDDPIISTFLREHPEYDPDLLSGAMIDGKNGAVLVKRPAALRLAGGTYLISATLLYPIYFKSASGIWSETHESTYQKLREMVRPLLVDDDATRAAALPSQTVSGWAKIFYDFEQFRFARLSAYLRNRIPDGNINFSILVYRLSDREVEQALSGPPP